MESTHASTGQKNGHTGLPERHDVLTRECSAKVTLPAYGRWGYGTSERSSMVEGESDERVRGAGTY